MMKWFVVSAVGYAFGHYRLVNKEEKTATKSYVIIAAIGVILSAATITVGFYFLAPLVKTEKRKLRLER